MLRLTFKIICILGFLLPATTNMSQCYVDGDSERCTSDIVMRRNMFTLEVANIRSQIKKLASDGKLGASIYEALYHNAMGCYADGQVPSRRGENGVNCDSCSNCDVDPEVCSVFCTKSTSQTNTTFNTTSVPLYKLNTIAYNFTNLTYQSQPDSKHKDPAVENLTLNSTFPRSESARFILLIILSLAFLVISIVILIVGVLLCRKRKICRKPQGKI